MSEQCVQGEGLVQVNLELKLVHNKDRINIIDVLKPQAEEVVVDEQVVIENSNETEVSDAATAEEPRAISNNGARTETTSQAVNSFQCKGVSVVPSVASSFTASTKIPYTNKFACKLPASHNENITRWVMDNNFRKEQERLKIPLGNYFLCFQTHDITFFLIQILFYGHTVMFNIG